MVADVTKTRKVIPNFSKYQYVVLVQVINELANLGKASIPELYFLL